MGAFVFVQLGTVPGATNMREVHDALHKVQGVKEVYFLAGPTDVLLHLEFADPSALMKALGDIRAVRGVASTDTRIVMPL